MTGQGGIEKCPRCDVDLIMHKGRFRSRSRAIAVGTEEISALYWRCPDCGHQWNRWEPGTKLHEAAEKAMAAPEDDKHEEDRLHYPIAHQMFGRCSRCPGVTVEQEVQWWRDLAQEKADATWETLRPAPRERNGDSEMQGDGEKAGEGQGADRLGAGIQQVEEQSHPE